jgi:hypothetical protein
LLDAAADGWKGDYGMSDPAATALTPFLQPTITLVGFIFIYFQIRATRRAIEAQTRASIASRESEIQKIIVQFPNLRNILFARDMPDEGTDDFNRVVILCAMYCDFFEYFLVEERASGSRSREAYRSYAQNLIDKSITFRTFVERNRRYYSRELGAFFDSVQKEGQT